jgi:hypothetical protein
LAKDEHREAADFDEGESSHAADEPTAVWDMEALRKAGLSELANLPDEPASAPATPAEGMAQRPSMIVEEKPGAAASPANKPNPAEPSASTPATRPSGGWFGLIAMALLLAAAAYLAIRLLR